MGRRQIGKKYSQRQEDKKRDRQKNVVAKKKAKGARPLKKKVVAKGLNYQRDELIEPTSAPKEPIAGEFAKAWEKHTKTAYLKGWTVGLATGAILTLAGAYALGYLK